MQCIKLIVCRAQSVSDAMNLRWNTTRGRCFRAHLRIFAPFGPSKTLHRAHLEIIVKRSSHVRSLGSSINAIRGSFGRLQR